MKKLYIGLLSIILVIALFLRVYKLDSVPAALFGDEIDVGYQAYSLLETGRDINGRFLPFYIKSLSEYRTPLFIYSDIPFIALFGLNEWGIRANPVFWGVLSILGLYLLVSKITNQKIGLIAAFLMTISPWHMQYSRAAYEATMLLSFLIFGTYFFILSFEKRYLVPLSFLILGLTPIS